jgi:hypothetical protein
VACRRAIAEFGANQLARKTFALSTDIADELLLDMGSACGHPKIGNTIAVFIPLKIAVRHKVRLRHRNIAEQEQQCQS